MTEYHASCHCGNVQATLDSSFSVQTLPSRACGCDFCRMHGAVTVSDPLGSLQFFFARPRAVIHYRFGRRTADFLICGECGTYVGAVTQIKGSRFGILNANTFDEGQRPELPVQAMDYEGETAELRDARRARRWTPLIGDAS